MYQATGSDSWTDGDVMAHEHQASREHPAEPGVIRGDPQRGFCGTGNLEAIMAGVVVVVIIALFLGGIAVGVVAAVAVSVRREDRRYSLAGDAPDRVSQSARRLNGLGRRDLDPELLRPVGELVH